MFTSQLSVMTNSVSSQILIILFHPTKQYDLTTKKADENNSHPL